VRLVAAPDAGKECGIVSGGEAMHGWAKWVGMVEAKWCPVAWSRVVWCLVGKCFGLEEGAQWAALPVRSGGVVSCRVVRRDWLRWSMGIQCRVVWCGACRIVSCPVVWCGTARHDMT
jgi:hypothetical protein